jgi:ribonucleoside-triphosphate reductase (formate)
MSKKCNVEVFSRVTGFFRPVQSWNEGKTEEFKDRKRFDLATMETTDEDSRNRKAISC